MLSRKLRMLVTVALANKIARIVWALMAHGGSYRVSTVEPKPTTSPRARSRQMLNRLGAKQSSATDFWRPSYRGAELPHALEGELSRQSLFLERVAGRSRHNLDQQPSLARTR